MTRFASFVSLAFAASLTLAVPAALAQSRTSDGVTNINQDGALAGSITAGDTAGFPITISTSGTYRLTSNLVVTGNADAIVISPMLNVVIDLNGFQIVGSTTCSKAANCAYQAGQNYGVRSEAQTSTVTVRNGRVRAFSGAGVWLSSQAASILEDVNLSQNQVGVRANNLLATRVSAFDNSQAGFEVHSGVIDASSSMQNGVGFAVVLRARIMNSIANGCLFGVMVSPGGVASVQGLDVGGAGTPLYGDVRTAAITY